MIKPKFIVDSMLGKIAKKLRIFGFDSLFISNSSDQLILNINKNEDRILITKDIELYKRSLKQKEKSILLSSENEIDNLCNILKYSKIKFISSIPNEYTRCTVCNGELNQILDKNHIQNKVPSRVFQYIELFYICTKCSKIYWKGSHIKKIQTIVDSINAILANKQLDKNNNSVICCIF